MDHVTGALRIRGAVCNASRESAAFVVAFNVYGGSKKPLRACTVNFLSFAFNSSL